MKSAFPGRIFVTVALTLTLAAGLAGPAAAESSRTRDPERTLEGKRVLSRTTLSSDLVGGPDRESVVLTEFLTGKKDLKEAIGILLTVYVRRGEDRVPVFSREYLSEWGGPVAGGELSLIDIDADGRNEIMISMHHQESAGSVNVIGEILWATEEEFTQAWKGPLSVNTTDPALEIPQDDRVSFSREIDYERTARTRGGMIFFKKRVVVTAGVTIEPPTVIEESFPLRPSGRL